MHQRADAIIYQTEYGYFRIKWSVKGSRVGAVESGTFYLSAELAEDMARQCGAATVIHERTPS